MKKLLRVSAIIILVVVSTAIILYQTRFADLPAPGEIGDHLVVPSMQIVDRAELP